MSIDPEITCGVSDTGRNPSRNLVVHDATTRPSRPPSAGEQHALDQQLTDDAAAAGAERETDGDLFLPRRRARDQQARDVGARDQQHAADDAEQQPQRLRQLLADRRAPLRRRQQIDLALEELLARVAASCR